MRVLSKVLINMLIAIPLAAAPNFSVGEAFAQRPGTPPSTGQRPPSSGAQTPRLGAEKRVEGEVKTVNPSGTEITLKDGTRLVTPSGAAIEPGVLVEGSIVVATYREENGQNVLTDLALREPAASPPTAPPTGSAPRY